MSGVVIDWTGVSVRDLGVYRDAVLLPSLSEAASLSFADDDTTGISCRVANQPLRKSNMYARVRPIKTC
jgi:hypothetical protein